jgi:sRNA-binding regulator protein Hfq
MKNIIFLLSFLILFQSCFTYKTVDYKNISIEKKQKFEVEKLDRTNIKGRIVSKNNKTMIFENNGERQLILKHEIYEVKVRKFSILKTARAVKYIAISVFVLALSLADLN